MTALRPQLVAGRRYRDREGIVWQCVRVTPCSATVVEQHAQPKTVTVGERSFTVASGRRLEISPRSALERIGEV